MSTINSIRFGDLLPLAWSALRRNRLRSVLTIGAISVGIAVMVYLISLGLGLQALTIGNVERSASLLTLTVNTGSHELFPLNQKSVEKAAGIPGVKEVLPSLRVRGDLFLDKTSGSVTIVGVEPDYMQISDESQLSAGQYYRAEDAETMVVTTGILELFGLDQKKVPLVTFTISLDGKDYPGLPPLKNITVTGVVESRAQVVYLPRLYLEKSINNNFEEYENLKVVATSLDSVESVRDQLIANAFSTSTVIDTVQEIRRVFKWITGILTALGLIAIFVASIGMFNTLTISLLERTREIGIMKALGVRRRDISKLFIIEAMLMGILGGGMGLIIAWIFQQLTLFILSLLASIAQGIVPVIFLNHWMLLIGAFLFAILIASVTGIYPARRATRLNPIDAIRHE